MDNPTPPNPPVPPTEPTTPPATPAMKHDHWFVQMVGGIALANTIISGLAIFWVFMEFGLPSA